MQNIEEIYIKYFKTVYKYLFCLTKNHDLSEEITQETFYKAIKSINKFNNNCKISVWLCQIARNTLYNELKKIKRDENLDENRLDIIDKQKMFEEAINDKLDFFSIMERFNQKTKEIIYLRTIDDFSFKEIAKIVGVTENYARVTFYRSKIKLKEDINNERK